ncbi:MAG: 23S rRNA (pseudouridine(1915)-N(3))-methyltransferase RlmH [Lachnospiraceae bacterium]|nr:23S rRNA (pseudouridine(1915)-N(3))-methyltransferase RlmH [Lachnospiraceae bacterium]
MNIDIICVGRIKEKFLKDAIAEYSKRLSSFCRLNIIEVADEKTVDGQSEALNDRVRLTEGKRILKHIKSDAMIISLEIEGKQESSVRFAGLINDAGINGCSHIQFIIGGSLGLDDTVTQKADMHLSFSKMTFPHQLMRIILLEQIYRSFKINNNEPYHK